MKLIGQESSNVGSRNCSKHHRLNEWSWNFLRRLWPVLCFLVLLTLTAQAQNYLTATGAPSFSAPEPVEYGFVESANGNLHLEFPLGSFPQRGSKQPYTMRLVYDSHIWQPGSSGNNTWTTPNVAFFGSGFRYVESTWGQITETDYSWLGCGIDVTWTDGSGTARFFPLPTVFNSTGQSGCATSADAFATDSSGYHLYMAAGQPFNIYAPDGTIVFHGGYNGAGWETDAQGNKVAAKDSNGNYLSLAPRGFPVDTLGRIPALTTLLCTSTTIECFDVANSQSSASLQADSLRSHFMVTNASVAVKTAFGQSGIAEFSGNINVVQSISLPDGTSYGFKYDCDSTLNSVACSSPHGQSAYYGVLTTMTLPTGGQIRYGYSTFTDSYGGKSRWLNSKSSAGGTWSYTPQVLTTCGSGQVGCQQKLTVTKPSGDSTVYTFKLDNGSWPTQIDSYGAGVLLSTVKNTWDFTQPCALHLCTGHGYIRKLSEATTVYGPGNAPITKNVQYTYSTPQIGLITAVKEWKFYSGAAPTFPTIPDRATNITYYTGGTGNIDRPTSVTVCNASGSDANCPGGGSKVSRTVITYDSYPTSLCGVAGLGYVGGITNHDDTNYGTGYLTRGNPTQIQRWVSGTTYVTTQLGYDITGQVVRSSDPNGNCTSYSYADSFYQDGANPPAQFTSPAPTNAYITQVTLPTVGGTTLAQSFGYYYGSGKQARATDPNGQSSFSHFIDLLDRPTGTNQPLGWSLINYTSPTPSQYVYTRRRYVCVNGVYKLRHNQITFDAWARKVNEQLVNNPDGATNVDTVYGANDRIQSVSHPYENVSDRAYESFTYDGFDRTIATTHPDSQSARSAYGVTVGNLGGLTSQLGAAATYGYGYPAIQMDEAGKQRQEWSDGFGNIIEVDEPGSTAGTPGSRAITINAGTLKYMFDPCGLHGIGSCPYEVDNNGTVTVTVNGYPARVGYGSSDSSQSIASSLAGALSAPGSPVTATANGAIVTMTAVAPGATTNYSFSSSSTYSAQTCDTQPCFTSGPFTSPASGTLTGGTGGFSTSPVATLYKYDVAGRVTQVVQGVQTRTFAYDGLGRVTTAQMPEVSNTPAAGTQPQQCQITFTYDANGNILTRTAPAPNQTSCTTTVTTYLCYDALDRMTGKAYTAQSCPLAAPAVSFAYDQGGAGAYALGRLTSMTDASGSESYSHDKEGRLTQVKKVIGTTTFTTAYQPNVGGQLKQITYPSGRIVTQSYDAIGRLTGVTSGGTNYTSTYSYDAAGHVLGFNYANGVAAGFTYSPDRLQLTGLSYVKGSQTLLSLNYGYKNGQANCGSGTTVGNDGLIQCVQDATGTAEAGRSVVYGYDPLSRLTSAVTTGSTGYPKWGLSWTYDRYGNRLTQAVTAGISFSNTLVFATLPSGVGAYTNRPDTYPFDAKGNMLNDGINTLTYDVENRIVTSTGGSGTGAYIYDGGGTRVKKCLPNCTSPTSSTAYVFSGTTDIAEYDNGAVPALPSREYIYSGGSLVATLAGGTATYHHADHLSVRVNTDANGNKIGERGHYPYGEQWYVAGTTTKFIFTTYERDSESGNDYAMARFYVSRFGRFCSVDPVGGSPGDPQSWNRYAYARNNPINVSDPGGTFWRFLFRALLLYLTDGASGIGDLTPGVTMPDPNSTTVWNEQLPISTSQGIPQGGIIDEKGGFGQSFQEGASGAGPIGNMVYCSPTVMDAIQQAWNKQMAPNMLKRNSSEAGFPATKTSGGYSVGEIQTGSPTGFRMDIPQDAAAVFHTHPSGTSGLPSTPRTTAGPDGSVGDTGAAVAGKKDIYVISDEGLSVASASGPTNPKFDKNNSPWIVQGNGVKDWLGKLKKKCAQ